MAVSILGSILDGLEARDVMVEAHPSETIRPGQIQVVGLPGAAVKEGMHRARLGIWPEVGAVGRHQGRGILVNLSPADLPKGGRSLDLPLAMVYAAVLLGLPGEAAAGLVFVGEVGLGGEVRGVPGMLAFLLNARQRGHRGLVLPYSNLAEARLVEGLDLYPVHSVGEALEVLRGAGSLDTGSRGIGDPQAGAGRGQPDFCEVQGQFQARRALEIAAAGGHNLLMEGPPGSGKTMLARRLPTILPPLGDAQALETARIHSALRALNTAGLSIPPFRSPHHTATPAGLTGGGQPLRAGEFSLAHNGVLFLDEFPEFHPRALEALREPIEEGVIHLTRAGRFQSFPADFICIAAMNPCPCGFFGLDDGRCRCSPGRVARYRGRLSGPLLDRFDLRVFLKPVPAEALLREELAESSAAILKRVLAARALQQERRGDLDEPLNGAVSDRRLRREACYTRRERALLVRLLCTHRLSARAARRMERVARTIADLEGCGRVTELHLLEALGFRLGSCLEGV